MQLHKVNNMTYAVRKVRYTHVHAVHVNTSRYGTPSFINSCLLVHSRIHILRGKGTGGPLCAW